MKTHLLEIPLQKFKEEVVGNNPLGTIAFSDLPFFKQIINSCNKNIEEALDVIRKHSSIKMLQGFSVCTSYILKKCISLNDKTNILKLADLLYKDKNIAMRLKITIRIACFSDCYRPSIKLLFDLYKMFKDDPVIAQYSHEYCEVLFPIEYYYNCSSMIQELIVEGCDEEAIELYSIAPLNNLEKEKCLHAMLSLFKAKGLSGYVEKATLLLDNLKIKNHEPVSC